MGAIKLVTFDVTNTIIRVLGGVGHNYSKVAALYDKNVEPAKIDAVFPSVFKRYISRYPNFGVHDGLTPNKWWHLVVKDSFLEAGSDDNNIDKIAQHLYMLFATSQAWEVLPGARKALEDLLGTGVNLGIISNTDDRLDQILSQHSLRHYFQFVLPSTVVRSAKPDEEIFQMALKAADVKPGEAIHVGDNAVTDYKGAKNAGMNALLLWKQGKELPSGVKKHDVIFSLTDIKKHLLMKASVNSD